MLLTRVVRTNSQVWITYTTKHAISKQMKIFVQKCMKEKSVRKTDKKCAIALSCLGLAK